MYAVADAGDLLMHSCLMTSGFYHSRKYDLCRAAYEQETRKIVLSLERATKVAPNGKQILSNVDLGMHRRGYAKCMHA